MPIISTKNDVNANDAYNKLLIIVKSTLNIYIYCIWYYTYHSIAYNPIIYNTIQLIVITAYEIVGDVETNTAH